MFTPRYPRVPFLERIGWQQTFTPATAALRRGTTAVGVAGNLSSGCICCTNPNANDDATLIENAGMLLWGEHPIRVYESTNIPDPARFAVVLVGRLRFGYEAGWPNEKEVAHRRNYHLNNEKRNI